MGMRDVRLEKLTLNIGAGEAGPKLDKGRKIIEKITQKKAVLTRGKKRTTFGTVKGRQIGVKVTLRGKQASDFLKNALKSVGNKLNASQFDSTGNFSFGIEEYINLPGIKYDPDVGMMGMDVCVTLERPGYRIKKRMIRPKKVGKKHLLKKEDSIEFVKKQFGINVIQPEKSGSIWVSKIQ